MNIIDRKMFYKDEPLPEGYWIGRTHRHGKPAINTASYQIVKAAT